MIGSARIMSPIAAGIVSNSTSRTECASAERNSFVLPTAALRETNGSVTVATATPKIPRGNCIKRKAMFSHVIGPSPIPDAKMLLTATFTCTALAEMRMTPIGLWIEPVTKRFPADDGAEIEKTRGHRRDAEDVSRVQHSHDQRSQRHEQNERKHDPREQHGELRFFKRKTGRKNIDK